MLNLPGNAHVNNIRDLRCDCPNSISTTSWDSQALPNVGHAFVSQD